MTEEPNLLIIDKSLPLKEYVLVSQEEAMVDTYYQANTGLWEIRTFQHLSEKVQLKSLSVELAMKDIYLQVAGISL